MLIADYAMHNFSLQAAAGSTGSNGLRDLAKTGSEDFWGTSSRLDRASTRQRNRDLLLQDSQVIYHRTGVRAHKLPFFRDCFEDELVPVFASVGRIYELRLMIEFSGTNRTYCYVR